MITDAMGNFLVVMLILLIIVLVTMLIPPLAWLISSIFDGPLAAWAHYWGMPR
jgi:ABC-type transport system involved in multi-copper enzyme maturation permease subunit